MLQIRQNLSSFSEFLASIPQARQTAKIAGYLFIPSLIRSLMAKKQQTAEMPASFEEAMAELAQLVAHMEAGTLPLEASVAAYQRGSELIRYCAAQLERVDNQVKVLQGEMLKPFAADTDVAGDS